MPLIEDLQLIQEGRNPFSKKVRGCRTARLLEEEIEDSETRDLLRTLIEDTRIPIAHIEKAIKAQKISIGWGTLNKHRDHSCSCYTTPKGTK